MDQMYTTLSGIKLDDKLKNNVFNHNIANQDNQEYLLNPENNRLTTYPIQNPSIWNAYKKQQAAFWTADEIDFSKDYDDFSNKLNANEQYFIEMILAFFSLSDTIVNINIGERFINDIKIREAIVVYDWQKMMENIHSEVYSLQIDNIVKDPVKKNKLLNAVKNYECIAQKINWAVKWIESDKPYAYRVVANAIFEGVFFSGSFCAIYWLKKRNIMHGLTFSNELISRDEGMHCNFAVLLYSHLKHKISQTDIHAMFEEAVEIERQFICDSLPCALLGMNADLMTEYIKFIADRLLVDLGYSKLFMATNPFDFMESISVEGKTNFFEKKTSQYQKSSVFNKTRDSAFEFNTNF